MRLRPAILVLGQAALVAGLAYAIRAKRMPLGVAGEWEWPRVPKGPAPLDLAIATAGVLIYAAFVAWGAIRLARGASRTREACWLLALAVGAIAVQVGVHGGAPIGYGLTKWVTLHNPGSNGYYTIARSRIDDPGRFLAEYPDWIRGQDALHVGTHPPGLFLASYAALRLMESNPGLAKGVVDRLPESVSSGFRHVVGSLPAADRAALALTGGLVLLACSATVVPIYLLARSECDAPTAWAGASLWPLVPSAILFQPTADTAFPLLSASAMALAARSARARGSRGHAGAFGVGLLLALGMAFTLAFLPVGLVVAILVASTPDVPPRRKLLLILSVGAGFLLATLAAWAVTGANPFVVWLWNARNHARFYVEYPRSYGRWVVANPIELAVALGLPATSLALLGLCIRRRPSRAAIAGVAVLVLLNFSGKNLSEVARLWLPLMPPLLTASGRGFARVGGGPGSLAAVVSLQGVQTLALQAMIQVVYPT